MKLLPVLLGVALLVLIMETGETEGGPRPDSEGGETENQALNGRRLKIRSLWDNLETLGRKYKEKAEDYVGKLLAKH